MRIVVPKCYRFFRSFHRILLFLLAIGAMHLWSGVIALTADPGPAAKLAFSVQPVNATTGATIAPAVKVAVQDADGITVTSSEASVTLEFGNNAGGGTLSGTLTVTAVNGVATFSDLAIDNAAPGYTLKATSAELTAATSTPFAIVSFPDAAASLDHWYAADTITGAANNAAMSTWKNLSTNLHPWFVSPSDNLTGAATYLASVENMHGMPAVRFVNQSMSVLGWHQGAARTRIGAFRTTITDGIIWSTSSPDTEKLYIENGKLCHRFWSYDYWPAQPANANRVPIGNGYADFYLKTNVTVNDGLPHTVAVVRGMYNAGPTTVYIDGQLAGQHNYGSIYYGYYLYLGDASFTGEIPEFLEFSTTLSDATIRHIDSYLQAKYGMAPRVPAKLVFTSQPGTGLTGLAMTPAVKVAVQDAFGNLCDAETTAITIALGNNPANATLSGATTVNTVGGVATFSTLCLDKAGVGYTFIATAGELSSATSAAFNVDNSQVTLTGFTPATGYTGTVVTITGENFSHVSQVKFNGTSALCFSVDSDTQITAVVPAGATTGLISVTNPQMTATSAMAFTINPAATRPVERHIFEAEDMQNDGVNWRVVDHEDGWWYSGAPSRGKMLYGYHGGQAQATRTVTLDAAGYFNFWVRYTDCLYYRGPFTVTLKQNGVVKATKTYDSTTLRDASNPAGQAKWGSDYQVWVWISMPVLLQAGPVEVVLTKADPIGIPWVSRLVDCFCFTTDLNYEPKIEDFATPLYMKVKMGPLHTEPCVIHMQGRRPFGPYYYLPGINFWDNQVVENQYYTGYNPANLNPHFLSAGEESPWYNVGPQLAPVRPHALWIRAMKEYSTNFPSSSEFTVYLSTTPSDAGIFKEFNRTGSGYAMLVNVDPRHTDEARSDLEFSQADSGAANFLPERPTRFPVITGCSIGSGYQPATFNNEMQTMINLGYNGMGGYDPLFYQNGFTKITAMNYLYYAHWNGDCMSDLNIANIRSYMRSAAQPYIDAGVTQDVVAWFLADEPGSLSMEHIAGNPGATPPTSPCPTCTAKFRTYLQGVGLQPAHFGVTAWTDVYPSNDPVNQSRRYYHTVNYRCKALANLFKAGTDALHEVVPNAKTTVDFAEELTMNGNMLSYGADWFMNLREGALTYGWTETWLAYSATYQITGYRADFLRSASPGGQFGMYNILTRPWDTAAKQAANIGHGAKATYDYNFGPDWSGAADGSSSYYARYPTMHNMHAAISRVDDDLVGASVPPSKVALLYPRATDVWSLNDADGVSEFGKERMGLFLLLCHLGYPVDIVTEQDVVDGKLTSGQYQMAFLSGSHIRRDAASALVSWVQSGGRLYYNAGSLTYDEYNQPLNLDATLGIPRQAFALKQHAGREVYELPGQVNNDPFTFNGTALEGIIGVQKINGASPAGSTVLATFTADNSPALLATPCGDGQLFFCGAFPGLAYQRSGVLAKQQADQADPNRATYGAPSFEGGFRSMIAAVLNGISYLPPAATNHYLVEANLLAGSRSKVIALSNWTGQQRTNVTLSVPISEEITEPYAALGAITSASQQNGVLTMTLNQLDELDFIVVPLATRPLAGVTLQADAGNVPLAGHALLLHAAPVDGVSPEYSFTVKLKDIRADGSYIMQTIIPATAYAASPDLGFTPADPGAYTISVTCREHGTTAPKFTKSLTYAVGTPALTGIASFTADQPSGAVAGTLIHLTATPSGTGAGVQYKFNGKLKVNAANGSYTYVPVTLSTAWGGSSCSWTPAVPGAYTLTVTATDPTYNVTYSKTLAFLVKSPAVKSITGFTASPGTGISRDAIPAGGITLTATVDGTGDGVQYYFAGKRKDVQTDGSYVYVPVTLSTAWGGNTFAWHPAEPGMYTLTVAARDASYATSYTKTLSFLVKSETVKGITGITASPGTGVSLDAIPAGGITLTAAVDGTGAGVHYLFTGKLKDVQADGSYVYVPVTLSTTWSENTFAWHPTAPGTYTLTVAATDAGFDTVVSKSVTFTVLSPALKGITSFTPSVPSGTKQANLPAGGITFTAAINGDNSSTIRYRYKVMQGATPIVPLPADYAAANTFVFAPTALGTYSIYVYAYDDTYNTSFYKATSFAVR